VADFGAGLVADFGAVVLGCEGVAFGAEPLFGGSGGGVFLGAAGLGEGVGRTDKRRIDKLFIVSLLTFLGLL
jgi:hypothetical protein